MPNHLSFPQSQSWTGQRTQPPLFPLPLTPPAPCYFPPPACPSSTTDFLPLCSLEPQLCKWKCVPPQPFHKVHRTSSLSWDLAPLSLANMPSCTYVLSGLIHIELFPSRLSLSGKTFPPPHPFSSAYSHSPRKIPAFFRKPHLISWSSLSMAMFDVTPLLSSELSLQPTFSLSLSRPAHPFINSVDVFVSPTELWAPWGNMLCPSHWLLAHNICLLNKWKQIYIIDLNKCMNKWNEHFYLFDFPLNAGKDWGQEEKGATEDEMIGWHHWLNKHEFEHSGSWWWTGKPGMLRSMGLQRVGHDLATEQQLNLLKLYLLVIKQHKDVLKGKPTISPPYPWLFLTTVKCLVYTALWFSLCSWHTLICIVWDFSQYIELRSYII